MPNVLLWQFIDRDEMSCLRVHTFSNDIFIIFPCQLLVSRVLSEQIVDRLNLTIESKVVSIKRLGFFNQLNFLDEMRFHACFYWAA